MLNWWVKLRYFTGIYPSNHDWKNTSASSMLKIRVIPSETTRIFRVDKALAFWVDKAKRKSYRRMWVCPNSRLTRTLRYTLRVVTPYSGCILRTSWACWRACWKGANLNGCFVTAQAMSFWARDERRISMKCLKSGATLYRKEILRPMASEWHGRLK